MDTIKKDTINRVLIVVFGVYFSDINLLKLNLLCLFSDNYLLHRFYIYYR